LLEKMIMIEKYINKNIENSLKKRNFKDIYDKLIERTYLDSIIRSLEFEIIISVKECSNMFIFLGTFKKI
jgi:hypothetical protein